jgi:selenocysteine lyase/cysteine desulfurase
VEVPVFPWPRPPRRILRVSTPLYVTPEDIARLVAALGELGVTRAGAARAPAGG